MDKELLLKNVNEWYNENYETFNEIGDNNSWGYISRYQTLSESFIREFKDKVDWSWVSYYQKLSESFIREFKDKVDWWNISTHQTLSEDFMREFKDRVKWWYISKYQTLSENFIRKFKDKVDWDSISTHQMLSEDFIREFKDRVKWWYISKYQTLSENFIRKFKDKVDWGLISEYQTLSEDFIREFKLEIDEDSWLYKDTKFKKQQVIGCGLYECHDDYFIAYKGIGEDGKSKYDPRYKYEIGKTYESRADFTDEENSFGLSAWTYENAKSYCDERVVKVKVYYKDVARVVHDNYKIRCIKQEILEDVE